MTPEEVVVVTIDGAVHQVTERTSITMLLQTGPVDEEQGRTGPFTTEETPATRYTCGCGLTVDAPNTELGAVDRWIQGASVDCSNGC